MRSFIGLLVLLTAAAPGAAQSNYAESGWATLHRDAGNRRLAADAPLHADYWTWRALGGASVLTAPTLSPDGATLYVTTGLPPGESNLHAYALDGEPLWRAAPWRERDVGVDPCAILSSAIVDREGDVYIGDCNQLHAFRPGGSQKWTVPLPPLQEGDHRYADELAINALTTAAFTRDGLVLGVTNFGDVVALDRATGDSRAAPFRVPRTCCPWPKACSPRA